VTAGCSALSGSEGQQAPGIADDELENETALLEAHAGALTEAGYSHRVTLNQTRMVDGERAELTLRTRTGVAAGATGYEFQEIRSGAVASRVVVWGNETAEYRRIEVGGSTPRYQRGEPSSDEQLAAVGILGPHLTAPFEVVDTEKREDGPTLLTLSATGQPTADGAFPEGAENVENYEAWFVVDTDGRIYRFSAAAEYELEGEPAEYELVFEVTGLEDPGIQRPPWVEDVES
jgi:hypothetical protein